MENLLLTFSEHRYLRKHKLNLESCHNVKIILPENDGNSSFHATDIIFATVHGEKEEIENLKCVLKLKTGELKKNQDSLISSSDVGDVPVITLTDSESDSPVTALTENQLTERARKKTRKRRKKTASLALIKDVLCNVSSTTETLNHHNKKRKPNNTISPAENFISLNNYHRKNEVLRPPEMHRRKIFKVVKSHPVTVSKSSSSGAFKVKTISSTLTSHEADDSIIVLEDIKNSPLKDSKKNMNSTATTSHNVVSMDESVIILEDSLVPRPIAKCRALRPIIIDGSNVARAHGQVQQTYSCKGIQISVDYFLKKGHTEITVFVPHFRRYKTTGPFPTTDPYILEDLAKYQRVAFTPSRYVNNKRITCYDDRFIVELAAKTNGVILSNDNYKDLVCESPEFKKTIEERLLMFCFVGDMIMIPNDPLGRHGPCLNDFLSFEPKNDPSST